MTIEYIIEKLKDRKYLTVDEEEMHMQEVYDSKIGDIEEYMFLTPNWINKERKKERTDLQMLPTL